MCRHLSEPTLFPYTTLFRSLLGNAFFVAAEFAVMSARRSQIEPLADEGVLRAQTTLRAMENVSLMLACAQLGITVCSLLILLDRKSTRLNSSHMSISYAAFC